MILLEADPHFWMDPESATFGPGFLSLGSRLSTWLRFPMIAFPSPPAPEEPAGCFAAQAQL